jgi:hypothetical protein
MQLPVSAFANVKAFIYLSGNQITESYESRQLHIQPPLAEMQKS